MGGALDELKGTDRNGRDGQAKPVTERRARLRSSLEDAKALFPGPPRLRDAVAAYVADLRADGHPPERVVVDVKSLLAEIGFPRRSEDRGPGPAEQVVRWVIQAYYAPQHPDGEAR